MKYEKRANYTVFKRYTIKRTQGDRYGIVGEIFRKVVIGYKLDLIARRTMT